MNNTQISTNANSGNALLLHLHTLGEFSIGLDWIGSIPTNISIMCELIISDYGIVHETPEGAGDLRGECDVVPKMPNS